jgi:hypothetical protein
MKSCSDQIASYSRYIDSFMNQSSLSPDFFSYNDTNQKTPRLKRNMPKPAKNTPISNKCSILNLLLMVASQMKLPYEVKDQKNNCAISQNI